MNGQIFYSISETFDFFILKSTFKKIFLSKFIYHTDFRWEKLFDVKKLYIYYDIVNNNKTIS